MCWLHQSAQLWTYPTFLLVPLMGLALVECFAGYRAWRFLLGANGAILGFVGGAMVAVMSGSPVLVLVGAVGGAVAGAYVLATIAPLGSFVFAFGTATSLTMLLAELAGAPHYYAMPLGMAAGLAAAVAALTSCRRMMIAIAAIAGAQQLASAWNAYHFPYGSIPTPGQISGSELSAFVTLTALGLLLQYATSPAPKARTRAARTTGDARR